MKTFMLSGEFIRCRRERLWREFETSACFTRSMTVTKCCDLCYLASLNKPEDSPPPLEHAIRLICPNFKIPMENAINASTLLPMAITLKELGIKSSGYRRSSNEKKIFEAKVAENVKV
jgi:hypothetical protein